MSRMKPSRRKKFDEYREYMGSAFTRERTFLKTIDLVYGITSRPDKWMADLDRGNPLPVICYTNIIVPEDSIALFGQLTTAERIALNCETIQLFEDRDNAMILLSQELSERKAFFSRFISECDDPQPIEDRCIVDEDGCLLASVPPTPMDCPPAEPDLHASEDNDGLQQQQSLREDKDEEVKSEKDNISTTFEKLDLILYLVSPYLNCEDKILLDVALEDSDLRQSPYLSRMNLCTNNCTEAIVDISVDIYTDILTNRDEMLVGKPYVGWIFSSNHMTRYNSHRVPRSCHNLEERGCICSTSLRHLYRRKSYKRLRGIARSLDDPPRKRSQTVLGYNIVHTLNYR